MSEKYIEEYFKDCRYSYVGDINSNDIFNDNRFPFNSTLELFNYINNHLKEMIGMFIQQHGIVFKMIIDLDCDNNKNFECYEDIFDIVKEVINDYYDIEELDNDYINYVSKYEEGNEYNEFAYVYNKKYTEETKTYPSKVHLFYPFIFVNAVQYEFILSKVREKMKEIHNDYDWDNIIDNSMMVNGFRVNWCNKYDCKLKKMKSIKDKYYVRYRGKDDELFSTDEDIIHQLFITSIYSNLDESNLKEKENFNYVMNYGKSRYLKNHRDDNNDIVKRYIELINEVNKESKKKDKKSETKNNKIENKTNKETNREIENKTDKKIDNEETDNEETYGEKETNEMFKRVMNNYEKYDLSIYPQLLNCISNKTISNYNDYRDIVWSVYSLTYLFQGKSNERKIIDMINCRMSKENKYDSDNIDKLINEYEEGRITIKKVFDYARRDNEIEYDNIIGSVYVVDDDIVDEKIERIDLPKNHFNIEIFDKYVKNNDYFGAVKYYSKYYYHIINSIGGINIYCYQYLGNNNFDIKPIDKFNKQDVKFKVDDKYISFKEVINSYYKFFNVIDDARKPVLFIKKSLNKNGDVVRIDRYININNISKAMSINKIISSKKEDIDLVKTQKGFDFIVNDYIKGVLCLSKKRDNGKLIVDKVMTENKFKYLMDWVKGLFTVNRKERCMIFGSETQGTGKSSFAVLLSNILGHLLYCKDTNGKILFGDFNNLVEDKILYNIEEFQNTDKKDISADFKDLITGKTITINQKHKDCRIKNNYASFLITTNNVKSLNIFNKSDRRCNYYEILDIRVGDVNFFNTLHDYFDDTEVLKRFYHYVKDTNFNVVENKHKILDTPERKELIGEMTMSLLDEFIKAFYLQMKYIINNYDEEDKKDYSYLTNNFIHIKITTLQEIFVKYVDKSNIENKGKVLKEHNRNVFKKYITDNIKLISYEGKIHAYFLHTSINSLEKRLKELNIIYEDNLEAIENDVFC